MVNVEVGSGSNPGLCGNNKVTTYNDIFCAVSLDMGVSKDVNRVKNTIKTCFLMCPSIVYDGIAFCFSVV